MDDWRRAHQLDALVLGRLEPGEGQLVVRGLAAPADGDARDRPTELQGEPATSTAAMEHAALASEAGGVLTALGRRFGTSRLVRVTAWPTGALVAGDTVYVNASWLVALSPAATLAPAAPVVPPPPVAAPPARPLALDYNPYHLPASLTECASSVLDACACIGSGGCPDEEAISRSDFGSASEECGWVGGDEKNAMALCALALVHISVVGRCIDHSSVDCPVGTLDEALATMDLPECVAALNQCIDSGEPTSGSSSSGGDTKSNDVCQQCVDDCFDDCSRGCSKSMGCDSCKGSSKSEDSEGRRASPTSTACRASPGPALPPFVPPLLWLMAPLAYLLIAVRRAP